MSKGKHLYSNELELSTMIKLQDFSVYHILNQVVLANIYILLQFICCNEVNA